MEGDDEEIGVAGINKNLTQIRRGDNHDYEYIDYEINPDEVRRLDNVSSHAWRCSVRLGSKNPRDVQPGYLQEQVDNPSWLASWGLTAVNGTASGLGRGLNSRRQPQHIDENRIDQNDTEQDHTDHLHHGHDHDHLSGNASPLHAIVCAMPSPSRTSEPPHVDEVQHVGSSANECGPNHQQREGSEDSYGSLHPGGGKMGMCLMFVDVHYKVVEKQLCYNRIYAAMRGGAGTGAGDHARPREKHILHGITGWVAPGEMLALMGPSGSGKTTLLNLLGGRTLGGNPVHQQQALNGDQSCKMTGLISYNGLPYSKSLKRRMGFVPQDDMLYPHLTVKETLTYAALLRLSASYTHKEKEERAEQVIRLMGLERCRDTMIGNTFFRGVSGGERKRVCIGHEILINPSLLFLDEPTSGLDSTTALRIIQHLQKLAQGGHTTIVSTIHQPSSRVFHCFDKLILLAEGYSTYFGRVVDVMPHFQSHLGFKPTIPMNPADFLLDLCNGNTTDISLPSSLKSSLKNKEAGGHVFSIKDVLQVLVEYNEREVITKERLRMYECRSLLDKCNTSLEDRVWITTWWTQVKVLLERGLRERRHDYLSWLKVTQVMAIAILCGSLWWHSKSTTLDDLENQVGLLFFLALFWSFFPLFNSIFTFPLERELLAKERASDMYRLSAYFVARSISDLPLDLLLPTCFMALVYFMATLRMTIIAFSFTMLTIFLTIIASQGIGLLIGAAIMDIKKAATFGSVLIIALMLAGGYFVHHIPKVVIWLKYLSFQSYCYKLLIKIQYSPYYKVHKYCSLEELRQQHALTSPQCSMALNLLKALHGMHLVPGAEEVLALLAMAFLSRLLAYLLLRQFRFRSMWRTSKIETLASMEQQKLNY